MFFRYALIKIYKGLIMKKRLVVFLFCLPWFFGYTAWYLFPKAFPIVQIPLTTSRTDILEHAKQEALNLNFAVSSFEAITFESDAKTQTFIELEGGGKKSFTTMIDNHYYEPFFWHVRFFVPYQIHEISLYFTPNGTFYGFKETLSEDFFNENVTPEHALKKTVDYANKLNINLDTYTLIESSKQEKKSGRIDHSFVYERKDIQLNEGKYRVIITVSGEKITECRHFIKIPESFERKYLELRSYNNNLSLLGFLLMAIFYIIGACFIALLFYSKKKLFLWKPALLCASLIALLHLIQQLNQMPLLMMHYETITNISTFIIKQILLICSNSLMTCMFFSIIIAVAEGLTRKALPEHIQLWSLWKAGCANSTPILLQTIGGYALASFDLMLVVTTYLFTTYYFGWWNPSYALADPNILATYVPALNTIALSLQAGFIEECLFRAIPLACAILLGNFFNKKRLFIILGFILQAFIFGAAHASYPAQPFYARLFELIIPSFVWGIFYIRFGLLPIIICHVFYDTVWFSLPIFISYANGIWIQKSIIILYTALPLLVIAYQYYKTKKWLAQTPTLFLNGIWQESVIEESLKKPIITYIPYTPPTKKMYIVYLCTISLLMFILIQLFKPDTIIVTLPSKNEITAIAQQIIAVQPNNNEWNYIKEGQPLTFFSLGSAETESNFKFIWQKERSLLTTMLKKEYISLPGWAVRYVHFDGDISKRAEEAIIRIDRNKEILYIQHMLPENKEGTTLSEPEAIELAKKSIYKKYDIPATDLALKSITPSKKQFRTDWIIDFKVNSDNVLSSGETRVQIALTGNSIELLRKYIHLPEQWERELKNDMYYLGLLKIISFFIFFFCIILLLLYILTSISFASMKYKCIFWSCFFTIFCSLIHFFNRLPVVVSTFNTIEPWFLQMWRTVGFFLLGNILVIGICLIICSILCIQWPTAYNSQYTTKIWYNGLQKGLLFGLLNALFLSICLTYINGYTLPYFYEHAILFANSYVPSAFIIYHCMLNFLKFLSISLLYMYIIRIFEKSRIHYLVLLVCTTFGLPLYITPTSITFFGYLFVTLLCSLLFIAFHYLIHTKHSIFNPDKRADIGFLTGIYIANIYNEHIIQMVNIHELSGCIGSIIIIIGLSILFCKRTEKLTFI